LSQKLLQNICTNIITLSLNRDDIRVKDTRMLKALDVRWIFDMKTMWFFEMIQQI